MIDTINVWHTVVRSRDSRQLQGLLADDVVFHSTAASSSSAGTTKAASSTSRTWYGR